MNPLIAKNRKNAINKIVNCKKSRKDNLCQFDITEGNPLRGLRRLGYGYDLCRIVFINDILFIIWPDCVFFKINPVSPFQYSVIRCDSSDIM